MELHIHIALPLQLVAWDIEEAMGGEILDSCSPSALCQLSWHQSHHAAYCLSVSMFNSVDPPIEGEWERHCHEWHKIIL